MKKLPLSRGKVALVDNEDYKSLSTVSWYCLKNGYAVRTVGHGKDKKMLYLHREIMNAPSDKVVDHINGDILDNRRNNLRLCTHKQNTKNHKVKSNCKTGVSGVSWYSKLEKWHARIRVDYKHIHLGYFKNFKDAVSARKQAEEKYFGEYVRLNHG